MKTLHSFFKTNITNSNQDFFVRAEHQHDGSVKFYIRPMRGNGDTDDFLVFADPFNGLDILIDEKEIAGCSVENFRTRLRESVKLPRLEECDCCGNIVGISDAEMAWPSQWLCKKCNRPMVAGPASQS